VLQCVSLSRLSSAWLLQCATACSSVLQCVAIMSFICVAVAVCCSVLQCVAVASFVCVAVAVCDSALQYAAVCVAVTSAWLLQRVTMFAVHCSLLQWVSLLHIS